METLWEMDMSQADGGDGGNDTNQDNHNLFFVNDDIYVYVDHGYHAPNKIYVRRFDLNGNEKALLTSDLPSTLSPRMLVGDDCGNLAFINLKENASSNSTTDLNLNVYVLDSQLNPLKTYSLNISNHFLKRSYEWLNVSGNFVEGNFSFSIGCWHYCGSEILPQNRKFYPAKCDFNITDGKNVTVNYIHYNNGTSSLDTRAYAELTDKDGCAGMLYVAQLSENRQLVQSFAKDKTAPFKAHSPLLLYDSYESKNVMDQIDYMKDDTFTAADMYCFGAFPLKLGDEQLLVLPYKFNKTDGVKFKVAHWGGDLHSFSGLTELWQFPGEIFPSDRDKVFGAVHYFTRPKVLIKPSASNLSSSAAKEATIYAYMPGSLLGAYKITLNNNATPSNLISRPEDDGVKININRSAQTVEISNTLPQQNAQVTVYAVNSLKVYSANVSAGSSTLINLSNFQPGIYFLRVNDTSQKIVVK